MFKDTQRQRRGHDFTTEEFLKFPRLYSTEEAAENVGYKLVWAHFFVGDFDWWLIEYDPREHLAFGFVSLGVAHEQSAEFGYFSLIELEALDLPMRFIFTDVETVQQVIVERDLDWNPVEVRVAVPEALHKDWWFGEEG